MPTIRPILSAHHPHEASKLQTGRRALRVAAVVAVATAGLVMSAGTGAAVKPRAVAWTETGAGARVSQNGSMAVFVAAVTSSLDGNGAAVATTTTSGNSATDTVVRYYADGVGRSKETLTFGAPDANGVVPYTASGKCTGGTGVHKHENCSYGFTGMFDPRTNVTSFKTTGTTTR